MNEVDLGSRGIKAAFEGSCEGGVYHSTAFFHDWPSSNLQGGLVF